MLPPDFRAQVLLDSVTLGSRSHKVRLGFIETIAAILITRRELLRAAHVPHAQ
jgi:hypothetical protein